MKILGTYQSTLGNEYYNLLIDLVSKAIAAGDYAGGYTFSTTDLDAIKSEGTNFTNLAIPSAGDRAIDEDFNNPVSLLVARYAALSSEMDSFTAKIAVLIDVLQKDTNLLNQILESVKAEKLYRNVTPVLGATSFTWSFGVGLGPAATQFDSTDPTTGIVYTSRPAVSNNYSLDSNLACFGIGLNGNNNQYTPKNLEWIYNSVGFDELNYGPNWAELDFLEDTILLQFNQPQIDVELPANTLTTAFNVTGNSSLLGIPIYVKTFFHPRVNNTQLYSTVQAIPTGTSFQIQANQIVYVQVDVTASNANGSCSVYLNYKDVLGNIIKTSTGIPVGTIVNNLTTSGTAQATVTIPNLPNIASAVVVLVQNGVTAGTYTLAANSYVRLPMNLSSGYAVDPTSVNVYSDTVYYNLYTDYVVDNSGNVTLITIPDSTKIYVNFSENYPAYQCSIDQINWSPTIMFDISRPYADDETQFLPIPMGTDNVGNRTLLPIVDEVCQGTGLYIALSDVMPNEFLLRVYQDADASTSGKPAQLQIDFDQVAYMNKLVLAPYSSFPMTITSIDVQGFTDGDSQNLFTGTFVLDKETVFTFDSCLIGRVYVSLLQENYSIKQHQILPDDYLRREALNDLQALVPIRAQDKNILPSPIFVNGYQYSFGIENISGSSDTGSLPIVFVSGSYTTTFQPQTATIDFGSQGSVSCYLCYTAKDSSGSILYTQTSGVAVTNGTSIILDYNSVTGIASVEFGVKFVLRDTNACVQSYNLQVK